MNVQKLNLTELSTEEMKSIEGGAFFRVKGLLSAIIGVGKWEDVEVEIFGLKIV